MQNMYHETQHYAAHPVHSIKHRYNTNVADIILHHTKQLHPTTKHFSKTNGSSLYNTARHIDTIHIVWQTSFYITTHNLTEQQSILAQLTADHCTMQHKATDNFPCFLYYTATILSFIDKTCFFPGI